MTSRVVHLRLKDTIIAGCVNVYAENGLDPTGVPLAKIINKVLTAFISGTIQDGSIKRLDDEEAKRLIDFYNTRDEVEPPTISRLPKITLDENEEDDEDIEVPGYLNKETRGQIEAEIKKVSSGIVETSGDTFNSKFKGDAPKAMVAIPVKESNTIDWNDLKEMSKPDDSLVTSAVDDKVLQRAICLVYSELPISVWGTDTAKRNVESVYNLLKETEEN